MAHGQLYSFVQPHAAPKLRGIPIVSHYTSSIRCWRRPSTRSRWVGNWPCTPKLEFPHCRGLSRPSERAHRVGHGGGVVRLQLLVESAGRGSAIAMRSQLNDARPQLEPHRRLSNRDRVKNKRPTNLKRVFHPLHMYLHARSILAHGSKGKYWHFSEKDIFVV